MQSQLIVPLGIDSLLWNSKMEQATHKSFLDRANKKTILLIFGREDKRKAKLLLSMQQIPRNSQASARPNPSLYIVADIVYRVTGRDKKLMSDKYFEVAPNQQYKLKLQYRCNSAVIIHLGIACYDESRNLINPVQVNPGLHRCADMRRQKFVS